LCSRSESVSSRSRSSEPSRRKKRRTQPSLSALCPRSIALLATAGCQRSWPLKSRSRSHTRSVGASITVDRTMRITASSSELPLERIEAALEDAAPDVRHQLGFAFRRTVEFRGPLDKGAVAVSDRREPQGRHIVVNPHRRFEDRIGTEQVEVGKAEQLFP